MNVFFYCGAVVILAIITLAGLYAGRKVKTASDFNAGGRGAGAGIVAGSIIGTLVGGSSTIGTAQLAFNYGLSAWWFTLGGGLGSLVLGLVFTKPLYTSGIRTVTQVISREFGERAALIAVFLVSIGSFLSVVAQVLAGSALITSISSFPALFATGLLILLMLVYVVFGGVWGAGIVGIVKTLMVCGAIGTCGFLVLTAKGGLSTYLNAFPRERYFNLIARGPAADIGAGLSLVLGIVTSQPYIQSVIAGKSLRQAKTGAVVSAVLIPLIGLGGVFVGLYMKMYHPEIVPAQAFPLFIMQQFPAAAAGAVFAVLLVTVVGTGAGVALGISSLISGDVYKTFFRPHADDKEMLIASRLFIVVVLLLAALFSFGNAGSLILSWSFLSMGLRGAVMFVPLIGALWFPGRLPKKYVLASIIAAPVFVILGKFLLPASIDPLFAGIFGSGAIILAPPPSIPAADIFLSIIYTYSNQAVSDSASFFIIKILLCTIPLFFLCKKFTNNFYKEVWL